jgi:hypothetical protein
MVKVWYPVGKCHNKVGTITWVLDEYVEILDSETGQFVIVKFKEIEII